MIEYIVGVDIGGTFTDCVVVSDDGRIVIGKALSTPDEPAQGAISAIRDAAERLQMADERELLSATRLFFHACTVGENTLLTRTGPRTGLLTTAGFRDTMLMMRGKMTEGLTEAEAAHVSAHRKPEPLVPRDLIGEITERIDYKGTVLVPLDLAQSERVIDRLVAEGVQSFAICLLWSIANNTHERALADLLTRKYPELFISVSSEAVPFLGEYERTVTTVFNAYIGARISRYLASLQDQLKARGLRREPLIMQAYGGVLGIAATCKNAVGTIESGPCAGIAGSAHLGNLVGDTNILAADMGGTTFKVGVIRGGNIEQDPSPVILQYNLLGKKIWVESIGAGGGSIAWVDPEVGLLKVGPRGAGAKPGPVCYSLGGTRPTVSDADLVLGYLNPDYFFGGRMLLDKHAATRAIEESIAKPLGMTAVEAANGIFRITNAHMGDLVRKASIERGHDPRMFVLYAYGGAGPVHAARYAAELGIGEIVVPATSAVQGGMGLVSSDVVYEYGKTDHFEYPGNVSRARRNFEELERRARADLREAGFKPENVVIERSVDMRYRLQTHELNVPLEPGTWELTDERWAEVDTLFDELYQRAYGQESGYRKAGKDAITFRLRAVGKLARPRLSSMPLGSANSDAALKGQRPVFFQEFDRYVPTNIYHFESMLPGMQIKGPAVIESPITTIVVNPADRAAMDAFRNIRLTVGFKK